jgi:hypothetical protein
MHALDEPRQATILFFRCRTQVVNIQSVSNDVFFIFVFMYDRIIDLIARRSLDTSRLETTFGLIATIAVARRCHVRMFS